MNVEAVRAGKKMAGLLNGAHTTPLWSVMSVAGGSIGCTGCTDRTDPRNSDLPTYYIAGREKTDVCECTVI